MTPSRHQFGRCISGLTENGTCNAEATTTIWLSGRRISKTYIITNEVVTAGGRTYRENTHLTIARK